MSDTPRHPVDGLPVSATPACDKNVDDWEAYYRGKSPEPLSHHTLPEMLERRARAAEARVAELERELAYQTRRAYEAMDYMPLSGQRDFKQAWPEKMPEGWRPQGDNEQSERKP